MPFNVLSILNGVTLSETERTEEYQDILLDYRDIAITKHNKYSMEEIQELATGILITGGLQEPLVIGRVSGDYWLLSGHRRYAALQVLIQEGHQEFEKIPCRYKDMGELQFRMELLCGNTFNRQFSDYDLMMQAQEWKTILTEMRRNGDIILEKGERIRDYVAQILGESQGKIGQLNAIYKSASEEVMEKFRDGEIGITSAYEASKPQPAEKVKPNTAEAENVSESDTKVQPKEPERIQQQVQNGDILIQETSENLMDEKSQEIRKMAEEKNVSESDTNRQRDVPYHQPDMEAMEAPEKSMEYDRDTLLELIRDEESVMGQMKDYWLKSQPKTYTKHSMKIQAYKLLLEQNDRGIISCPHRS